MEKREWQLYDLEKQDFFVSRDVVFSEGIFPFAKDKDEPFNEEMNRNQIPIAGYLSTWRADVTDAQMEMNRILGLSISVNEEGGIRGARSGPVLVYVVYRPPNNEVSSCLVCMHACQIKNGVLPRQFSCFDDRSSVDVTKVQGTSWDHVQCRVLKISTKETARLTKFESSEE
ncbi:hypothetical protein SADUNF_Sadunf03G0044200 [Salix dunnii]|uniref:Uncharacterized protein n=1 Tax=Salix dunnii TaxID=1413687 RepID=A0A835K706_9ROSI|nr:hypothetical protein SADUNF_Sadunf03G0044200 [Salix dunnii]